jgi:hypothetical protein
MRLPAPTAEVMRFMGTWVRRADSGLARSAALNAASSMYAHQSRELEDARTLHDLLRVPPFAEQEPEAVSAAAGSATRASH